MKLVEAQAKSLLIRYGVATPPSQQVTALDQLDTAMGSLSLPVFVKAQVPLASRAHRGLVIQCRTPDEVRDAVRNLLGRTEGRYRVGALLIETAIQPLEEIYAAVTVDLSQRRPVLLVSGSGGTGVESRIHPRTYQLSTLYATPPWLGLRAAVAIGYRGERAVSLGKVLSSLVTAFFELDALLVEINPLALSHQGWIALDARVELDDDALYRHPDAPAPIASQRTYLEAEAEVIDRLDQRGVAGRLVEFEGDLGLLIGGGGASLTVFDAVLEAGLRPANYCEIGGNPTVQKVSALTRLILSNPRVRHLAVVMNVVSNTRSDLIARGVIKGILEAGRDPAGTLVAFRVPGSWEEEARLLLSRYGIQPLGRDVHLDEIPYLIKERIASDDHMG